MEKIKCHAGIDVVVLTVDILEVYVLHLESLLEIHDLEVNIVVNAPNSTLDSY